MIHEISPKIIVLVTQLFFNKYIATLVGCKAVHARNYAY